MLDPRRALAASTSLLVPVAAVVSIAVSVLMGLGPGLLVLAGAALAGAVLLLWSSLERITGESPLTLDEAIGLGAPSPEEERKRAIVRALKDLEYEKSVGKISDADYAELTARYRAEGKALLRSLDTEFVALRQEAEQRLAARLAKEGLSAADEPPSAGDTGSPADAPDSPRASPPPDAATASERDAAATTGGAATPASRPCSACAAANDPDADFCKKCGTRLAAEAT